MQMAGNEQRKKTERYYDEEPKERIDSNHPVDHLFLYCLSFLAFISSIYKIFDLGITQKDINRVRQVYGSYGIDKYFISDPNGSGKNDLETFVSCDSFSME